MKVVVTTEHRFLRTPDGLAWTHGVQAYPFWNRYLSVFDGVKIVARVRETPAPPEGWQPASGPGVMLTALPDYLGPWQYVAKSMSVHQAIGKAASPSDAVILRVSSHLAGCLEPTLARRGQPFGVEVISDPLDLYSPGAVDYRLRPLFRWKLTRQMRRQCRNAAAAAYVTERSLQARYPCPRLTAAVSDVEIPAEAMRAESRTFSGLNPQRELRLITLASLAQMQKAPDVLIRAVSECERAGLRLRLAIAGDGRHRSALEHLAAELGLQNRVEFLGQLPAGGRVRKELDASDLFVLPSRCEGLPRALVEAMARSLPCVASRIGGIPELLPAEDLTRPGDVADLAAKLMEVLSDPARMDAMAARNLRRAADFRESLLIGRRTGFFREVRQSTSRWIERNRPAPDLDGTLQD